MMTMYNRHRSLFQASGATARAYHPTVRVGALCAVGLAVALFAGCGELEPMREPEVVDLELTTDTLKASVRDAQRMVTELRADLETRRRDLAEAQIARAQLEGRVREAERRVLEAQQVIELQREELAVARTERAHLSRNSLHSQGQMRQSQKQFSRTGTPSPAYDGQEGGALSSSGATAKGQKAGRVPAGRNRSLEFQETAQTVPSPIGAVPVRADRDAPSGGEESMDPPKHVSVKFGDTLWRISQKYRVRLEQLRALNGLTNDRIIVGQALRLRDDGATLGAGADTAGSTP